MCNQLKLSNFHFDEMRETAFKNVVKHYNNKKLHLSLDYKTPNQVNKFEI